MSERGGTGGEGPPAAQIVHRDGHLLVVDKPAGLVVHAAPGVHEPTLVDLLGDELAGGDRDRPGIVHRIDRDTSGLLLVARSERAHAALSEQIRERAVEREYAALAVGRLPTRTGTIDAPLGRDYRSPERVTVGGRGRREARTHFEVEELLRADTLLAIRLETGRTHQIRAHFEAIGHPLAGDPRYGGAGRHGLKRQFLHARRLAFEHPISGERIAVSSALPEDLVAALERARAA